MGVYIALSRFHFSNSELALRAVLLHTEALKSRELFAEAAVCFLRLADAVSFLFYHLVVMHFKKGDFRLGQSSWCYQLC